MTSIRRLALDERGEGNQGALIAIVLLIIALLAVFFAWQRDSESVDPELDVDIGSVPVIVTYDV
jgi:hypothetical protein